MMNAVWSRNAVLYEMNLRQTTSEGTLAAAAERLGFLRDLGIDAVWLMPHYPIGKVGRKGSLGSYYSIRDYRAVDPELGTLADFDAFVRRAHALGMKVLIDWVANHTSRDARWLAECPADWYERDASGRPVVPNGWDDTAKLDYTNRAVWQGQIDAMRFWLAEHGVDGFRCDMAMLVPIEFWQEAARRLRAVKPDLFLLAEAEEELAVGVEDAGIGDLEGALERERGRGVEVAGVRGHADRHGRYPLGLDQREPGVVLADLHDEEPVDDLARVRVLDLADAVVAGKTQPTQHPILLTSRQRAIEPRDLRTAALQLRGNRFHFPHTRCEDQNIALRNFYKCPPHHRTHMGEKLAAYTGSLPHHSEGLKTTRRRGPPDIERIDFSRNIDDGATHQVRRLFRGDGRGHCNKNEVLAQRITHIDGKS